MSPVVLFKLTEALVMCHIEHVKNRKPPFVCFPGFTKFRKGIHSLENVCVCVCVCVWCVCACTCIHICLHITGPSSQPPSFLLRVYSGEISTF